MGTKYKTEILVNNFTLHRAPKYFKKYLKV